jgi:hypothetical protein
VAFQGSAFGAKDVAHIGISIAEKLAIMTAKGAFAGKFAQASPCRAGEEFE